MFGNQVAFNLRVASLPGVNFLRRLLYALFRPRRGRSSALEGSLREVTALQQHCLSLQRELPELDMTPVHLAREDWLRSQARLLREGWDVGHLKLPPLDPEAEHARFEQAEALAEVDRLLK